MSCVSSFFHNLSHRHEVYPDSRGPKQTTQNVWATRAMLFAGWPPRGTATHRALAVHICLMWNVTALGHARYMGSSIIKPCIQHSHRHKPVVAAASIIFNDDDRQHHTHARTTSESRRDRTNTLVAMSTMLAVLPQKLQRESSNTMVVHYNTRTLQLQVLVRTSSRQNCMIPVAGTADPKGPGSYIVCTLALKQLCGNPFGP